MSGYADKAAVVHAPAADGAAPQAEQTLSGTTGEDNNATALTVGHYATIRAGSVDLRLSFRTLATGGPYVATTDFYLKAGTDWHWVVQDTTKFVYAQADDGASAWNAVVWTSGPETVRQA